MREAIIVALCSIAFFTVTYLFRLAKRYSRMDFSNKFIFNEEDYENKEAYAINMTRGIRTLALYLINCTFIFVMSTLANNINYYIFALLFLATTLVLWYVNMFKILERYQTKTSE